MNFRNERSSSNHFFKRAFFCFFICFCVSDFSLPAQNSLKADDIIGEWWTPNNDGRITFFKCGTTYSGKVSGFKNPNDPETGKPRLDKHNPDPSLRKRPIMGLVLFYNFEYNTCNSKYIEGELYDSDHGKTYSCWIKLINYNVLELHGFIGFSLIGKSVYFTRVRK